MSDRSWDRPRTPVFVTGFPRSGTTLLSAALSLHSSVEFQNECEIFDAYFRAGHGIEESFGLEERASLLSDLRKTTNCARHLDGLPEDVLATFGQRAGRIGAGEVYELLLPRGDTPVWGDKSLNNVHYTRDLLTLYPRAVVIHIVRDGRAVVLSKLIKLHARERGRKTRDVEPLEITPDEYWSVCARYAMSWAEWARQTLAFTGGGVDNRVIVTRYEDLVRDAESVISNICAGIGLEPDARMFESRQREKAPAFRPRFEYAHGRLGEAIDSSRAESFRDMDHGLLWIIQKLAGRELWALGYEHIKPRISLLHRARYGARLLKSRARLRRALHDLLAGRKHSTPEA